MINIGVVLAVCVVLAVAYFAARARRLRREQDELDAMQLEQLRALQALGPIESQEEYDLTLQEIDRLLDMRMPDGSPGAEYLDTLLRRARDHEGHGGIDRFIAHRTAMPLRT